MRLPLVLTLGLSLSACSVFADKGSDDDDDDDGGGGGGWDMGSDTGTTGDGGSSGDGGTSGDGGGSGDGGSPGDGGSSGDGGSTGDGGSPGDGGSTGDGGEDCSAEINAVWPVDGDTDAYYRTDLTAELSAADPTARIFVEGPTGRIDGSTRVDDRVVTFELDDPLEPRTDYSATLDFCAGTASWEFRTGELGESLDTSLTGRTFQLALADATFVEPEGVGSLTAALIEVDYLVSVTRQTSSSIEMLMGMTDGSSSDQDLCATTTELPAAAFGDAPYFEVGPVDYAMETEGITVTLEDFTLSGAFASDGSYFGGGEFSASMDLRPLAPLLGVEDGDEMCALMTGFGLECEPCGDGEDYCLNMRAVDITAAQVDVELIERTAEAVARDPACE